MWQHEIWCCLTLMKKISKLAKDNKMNLLVNVSMYSGSPILSEKLLIPNKSYKVTRI
jgi:hypothetical protein